MCIFFIVCRKENSYIKLHFMPPRLKEVKPTSPMDSYVSGSRVFYCERATLALKINWAQHLLGNKGHLNSLLLGKKKSMVALSEIFGDRIVKQEKIEMGLPEDRG